MEGEEEQVADAHERCSSDQRDPRGQQPCEAREEQRADDHGDEIQPDDERRRESGRPQAVAGGLGIGAREGRERRLRAEYATRSHEVDKSQSNLQQTLSLMSQPHARPCLCGGHPSKGREGAPFKCATMGRFLVRL